MRHIATRMLVIASAMARSRGSALRGLVSWGRFLRPLACGLLVTAAMQSPAAARGADVAATAGTVGASGPVVSLGLQGISFQVTAGVPDSFALEALDGDGHVATGYTGTVHFTSNDPQATLPSDYTFTAADLGVHSGFQAIFVNAGVIRTLSVADISNSGINGTQTGIAVTPAAAASLQLLPSVSTVAAGTPFNFGLRALDSFGNVASGYRGSVRFTSDDALAALPADYAFVPADTGTHTFFATLKTGGIRSLAATDLLSPAIAGFGQVTVVGSVPEPGSWALMWAGTAVIAGALARRRL